MKLTLATAILALVVCAQAKIVYLNGTEVYDEKHRSINLSTTEPSHKWITNFNARNISNHSGSNLRPSIGSVVRKTDNEEEPVIETVDESDGKNEESKNNMMSTRDTTLLSSIRGIWSDINPILTVLSTLIGIFLMFVIVESPLSPLPVPPLPHSPVGPYPPTNMYPFGIPPPRNPYGVHYAGPSPHAGYRIPRLMKTLNGTFDNAFDAFQLGLKNKQYYGIRNENGTFDDAMKNFQKIIKSVGVEPENILGTIRKVLLALMGKIMNELTDRMGYSASASLKMLMKDFKEIPKE